MYQNGDDTSQKPSLNSMIHSLNASQLRGRKQIRKVTSKNDGLMKTLRPGRHRCECQARVHRLLRNCINCGRIVCEQEGSGPCFFCGNLVCTREERQIIDAGTSESDKLTFKLMGRTAENNEAGWAGINAALAEAEAYKDKLLVADADREKTNRVNDLESNYYSMESDIFLTKEERDAIVARKEELRDMRAKKKRSVIIDFDLANASVSEAANLEAPLDQDPVIQAIFRRAHQRQLENKISSEARWVPKGFTPKYNEMIGRRTDAVAEDEDSDVDEYFYRQFNEMMFSEVERKGFAFSLDQPVASLLALGIRRHILWTEDVYLRGPVFIAASPRCIASKAAEEEITRCRERMAVSSYAKQRDFPLTYPTGAIVGRALLADCLSIDEYRQQYPESEFEVPSEGFILIFNAFEPLLVPIPHVPPSSDFYRVDKVLRIAIKQILDPYSLT